MITKIIAAIFESNEENGLMCNEDSNERITGVLADFGMTDDEESIAATVGSDGLHAIRDAEKGIY